ncbi:molybdate ABC transporter substrate-binding protein [Paenibacillus beijingensis]|uniref:Molybdenum ABC transporter substrate-binding protein n=1 Tax=Paenibacillus beijingensis TaxID=1126833 RepID=A0A0D5NRS6_9BACL|nr:molybdate ABC transporter substrate-binding protein [Paenibacillus beijingensis]AJY77677.1 molybdenum ABC transporter substrate-binding protein [Paenibacillus beijingensis]
MEEIMLRKVSLSILTLALMLTVLFIPGQPAVAAKKQTELLVSAAASLKDSLDEIATVYEKAHPDIKLTFNYASSGTLQKQIEQGAPADLFFSAGKKQMDALVKQGFISERKTILTNSLVLVVPSDSKQKFTTVKELTSGGIKKVAVGQPESVPAGQYAKETLENRKVWDALQPKLVFAKDVRQVLTYVETGNVDAGFVYNTDALTSSKVKVALKVFPGVHTPIVYPAGVLSESKHSAEAKAFYTYLQSKEAGAVFKKYGFKLP